MNADLSVYLVTDTEQSEQCGRTVVETVRQAVAGGVTAVQVRAKHAEVREFLHLVVTLAETLPSHVSLFVNDRVDVFLAARSLGILVTGVHVGQRDLHVDDVRRLVGPEPVIGLSASTVSELDAAASSQARVDYVGIGVVRETSSKIDAPAPIGVQGVIRLAASCSLPAVAIGGIVPADLRSLRAGGLAGAAVASWVCASSDPHNAAAELKNAWEETR